MNRTRRILGLSTLVAVLSSCLSMPISSSEHSQEELASSPYSYEFDPVYAKALFSSIPLELVRPPLPHSEFSPQESFLENSEPDPCFDFDWFVSLQSPFATSGTGDAYTYSILDDVTDQHGRFQRVHASLRDEYVNSIPLLYSHKNSSLSGSGLEPIEDFTDEQMRSAIRLVSDFILNESLDSIVLDDITLYPQWLEEVGPRYYTDNLLFSAKRGYEASNPVFERWLATLEGEGLLDRVPLESFDTYRSTLGLAFFGAEEYYIWQDDGEPFGPGTLAIASVPRPLIRDGYSRVGNKHLHGFRFHRQAFGLRPPTTIIVEVKGHATVFSDRAVDYLASGQWEVQQENILRSIERENSERDAGDPERTSADFPGPSVPEGLHSYPVTQLAWFELVLRDSGWKINSIDQNFGYWQDSVSCPPIEGWEFDERGNIVDDEDGCPVVKIPEGGRHHWVGPKEETCRFSELTNADTQGFITEEEAAELMSIYDRMRYLTAQLEP